MRRLSPLSRIEAAMASTHHISAITIVPVLFLGLAGHSSLAALLFGGFFLGLGGSVFAVGVPFVNAWFPPNRRGLAIGIFGAGMGGTAISALTTAQGTVTTTGRTMNPNSARPGRRHR
jgi:MFS transporter, NNP family, nitrate/nitrite transporter